MSRSIPALLLALVLGAAACTSDGGTDATPPTETAGASSEATGATNAESSPAPEGLVLVSLGDSWPEGAHCNECRTFPQTYAKGLADELGEPVTLVDLAGQAQPSFDTPGKGGSAGLLEAIRTDEPFREQVASGDIIVIATGANDFGAQFEAIQGGTCGGDDGTACVDEIGRTWDREFDAILEEIEALRAGEPTAIRLVNAANAFLDPSFTPEQARGFAALFEALTQAVCDNAEAHGATCVDVRPALNGPNLDRPVNDSSQESMDAVAELLLETGLSELGYPSEPPVLEGIFAVGPDDLDVALRCVGEGSPTIVFEAGTDSAGIEDFPPALVAGLAERTTACTYDRPGTGSSAAPPERRRSVDEVVDILHQLLRVADVPGPYLLVGQSGGGLIVVSYADRYPKEAAGVVLLDVSAPIPDLAKEFPGKLGWNNPERIDWPDAERTLAIAIPNLGDLPVGIVTATEGQSDVRDQSVWLELSSLATQASLEGGHNIHWDNTEGVLSAILSTLEANQS
ncbi:MAG TPA: alpha/beta fold hydrolase [Actinomycetota bacterium]|jgi:hypothetical protein|nr:alpha/beta fold hydrolase [Actinomycetota bacterium]